MKFQEFMNMKIGDRGDCSPVSAPERDKSIRFEDISPRIFFRLESGHMNPRKRNSIPHIPFHDMVITFRWLYEENEEGISSALIENKHLEYWGVTEKEIAQKAVTNTPSLFPVKFGRLFDEIAAEGEYYDEPDDDCPLFVLSNEPGINGASVILYNHVLEAFACGMKGDFYILPSSIHELILVPKGAVERTQDLYDMVFEANRTVVSPRDFLSDSVFLYDSVHDRILLAPR